MIAQKRVEEKAPCSHRISSATRKYSIVRRFKMYRRYLLPLALLTLLLLSLLTACAGQQQTQDPAGTSTQDPPVPVPHYVQPTPST
jgi:hypothetical protein